MARRKDTLTLSVPTGTKDRLEQLAARHGYFWGSQPSPSGLVGAIAEGQLGLGGAPKLNPGQIQAMEQAVRSLVDEGLYDQARTLMSFLLAHGEIAAPLRASLMQKLSSLGATQRAELDRQIAARQPFYLHYVDVHGKQREFTVHFARIRFRERRSYLEIWADETNGNQDLPGLNHNWVLRLDRAQNIVVLPGGTGWREDMDFVEAELKMTNRLAVDYEPRQDDIESRLEETPEGKVLFVKRKVYSGFWFMREALAFGADCEVLSPPVLRERMRAEFERVASRYEA